MIQRLPTRAAASLAAGLLLLTQAPLAAQPAPKPAPLNRAALADRVREEFLHSWESYRRYAWGHDELKPLSHAPHDWHSETL